jgi:hypothetical protein
MQRWGLNLLGPLPLAQGNLKYIVVAVEYFSKWIEAKPLATITSATIQKFFCQNIVCRFGVPKAITVDNGTQVDAETFKTFCSQIGTKIHFASVRHIESNGLVERANEIIITGIMKSIFNQHKGKWPDELIKVVWNHNIAVSRSTGFTPFKLLFGDEAITPEEARTGSIRTLASIEDDGDCQVTKDTIEGTRLQAIEHINKYQAETIKWRDRKVRLKNIKPGHLVLRRVANPDTVGKLQLKREGPFLVVSSSYVKVFNGAIGCSFHSLFRPMQYKGQIPPYVKCNIRIRTIECKKDRQKLKSCPSGDAELKCHLRGEEATKSFLRERRVSSEAQKSFLRECRAKTPPK